MKVCVFSEERQRMPFLFGIRIKNTFSTVWRAEMQRETRIISESVQNGAVSVDEALAANIINHMEAKK